MLLTWHDAVELLAPLLYEQRNRDQSVCLIQKEAVSQLAQSQSRGAFKGHHL